MSAMPVRRLAPAILVMALPACVTPATPAQGMYAAFSAYSAALAAAADYAEQPGADPAVVRALDAANQSPGMTAARTYGRAFVLCGGRGGASVRGIDCGAFDFRAASVAAQAATLRAAALRLSEAGR